MLKLHKRSHEPLSPTQEPPCPSHRISFLDSPNFKRTRMVDPNAPAEGEGADANARPVQPVRPESPFVSSKRVVTNEDVLALRPKRMRQIVAPAAPPPPPSPTQEKVFSVEDVRAIVQRAIDEHEAYIRNEYNRVLQERLNEQYASFARFNQDAISRQLQQSPWNYMS